MSQHFPQGRGPGGWESQGSFTEYLATGQTLKGVSKDRSGARSEEEKGGHGQFRRDNEGKPGGDWDV